MFSAAGESGRQVLPWSVCSAETAGMQLAIFMAATRLKAYTSERTLGGGNVQDVQEVLTRRQVSAYRGVHLPVLDGQCHPAVAMQTLRTERRKPNS
jgi:hypothetical protein